MSFLLKCLPKTKFLRPAGKKPGVRARLNRFPKRNRLREEGKRTSEVLNRRQAQVLRGLRAMLGKHVDETASHLHGHGHLHGHHLDPETTTNAKCSEEHRQQAAIWTSALDRNRSTSPSGNQRPGTC